MASCFMCKCKLRCGEICDSCRCDLELRKIAATRAKTTLARIYGTDYPIGVDEFDYFFKRELERVHIKD